MIGRAAVVVVAGAVALTAGRAARADENADLGLIPDEIANEQTPPATPTPGATTPVRPKLHGKLFAEDALTLASPPRSVPVPYPGTPPEWQNRTSVDLALAWSPSRRLTLTLSDRLDLVEQDQVSFVSRYTVRNALREAYLTAEIAGGAYLEAGRINLRNGAALGFNPTDFFKTGTLVGQASLDPSAVRQNRLGTVMARAQKIWDGGAVGILYAPKLFAPPALSRSDRLGVDPSLDATNSAHRILGTLSLEVGEMSPQLLGYYEAHRAKLGLNLSRTFGDAIVAYAEWAGGPEKTLAARSFDYAMATESLPPDTAPPLPTSATVSFRHDLAAGASFTIASKVTLNAEYHFHQSGFGRQDWHEWLTLGSSPLVPPELPPQLWYIRGYAYDQQEPVSRHQLFVRLGWPRALSSRIEVSGFAFVDLFYGSTLAQLTCSYYLSNAWTLAAYASVNAGAPRSERGSLPQLGSLVFQVVRYL